ncbi:MAG: chemotaxis protein CheW [Ktedonobacteraceae bacterium]
MASDDLKTRQREIMLAQAMAAAQHSGASTIPGNFPDARESRPGSRAPASALESQLAQITQLRADTALPGAQPKAAIGEQYLVFSLLERECAIKAEHVQGVERLVDVTSVPNVAPWVTGVINLRGSIASVVDLRTFLDMEPLAYNPRTRLLSVQYNEMVICLVVDGVSEMTQIPTSAITDISVRQTNIPQWVISYAAGSALVDKRTIVLLDAARLLFSDKMQHYEALE